MHEGPSLLLPDPSTNSEVQIDASGYVVGTISYVK